MLSHRNFRRKDKDNFGREKDENRSVARSLTKWCTTGCMVHKKIRRGAANRLAAQLGRKLASSRVCLEPEIIVGE